MKQAQRIFAGIDIGSSRTKAAVLDQNEKIIGHAIERSGVDFSAVAEVCLDNALAMAGCVRSDISYAVATGYGRKSVPFIKENLTEISCHAKGCFRFFQTALTVIDIGGQDNKIIKLDEQGRRTGFKMNRKCAAGTGAFLEEMSLRLNIPLENMNDLAMQSEQLVELGSFCTVFTATEVLEKIRHGAKVCDIVKGLYLSVVKRALEMDTLTDTVVLTGGVVAYHPMIRLIMENRAKKPVRVPQHPQLTGAIGAALFAAEKEKTITG